MKRKILFIFSVLMLTFALSACGHTHAFGEWETAKEAACTEEGVEQRLCACGERETRSTGFAHIYKYGICTECGQSAREHGYTSAVPENQGVKNVIDRAYLLTDVEWTPLDDVPGLSGNGKVIAFEAGKTYKGIPYSGVTENDCYVGLNVSLTSYLTALKNTNSVLYTENLQSTNTKAATYYGTVCSKFVLYALDVPGSYNANNMANIPGMDTIALAGEYTLDQLKIGDVVVNLVKHTTMCTDILYGADGEVAFVEISEAVYPTTRRRLFSPEEFYSRFETYMLCRYQHIADAAAVETVALADSYALMPRFGDKYNYKVCNARATVDVLESGYYKAVILRDGVIEEEIVLNGAASFSFDRSIPGDLEMYLQKEDGTKSASVYARVVRSTVKVTDSSVFGNGKLSVDFEGTSGTPLYVQVGTAHAVFCNIEGKQASAELSFASSAVTASYVRVAYQNEYGVYISEWKPFSDYEGSSTDPLLSQAECLCGLALSPLSPIPKINYEKPGYFVYSMIPVQEKETYYSEGANRMWFLDACGNAISTFNASKESAVKYQFTVPEGAAFVSITYSPFIKGKEHVEIVHNYKNGVCLGCGAEEP